LTVHIIGGKFKLPKAVYKEYIMKQRPLIFIFISLLILVAGGTVFAKDLADRVDQTNDKIEHEIEKAIKKAEKRVEQNMGDEEKLQVFIDALGAQLIKKTEQQVDVLIRKAEQEGVTVVKEYIEVELGGTTFLVDPLWIH
jgi:archaellum component FlaG (FlaF/FlaG flagellin family)